METKPVTAPSYLSEPTGIGKGIANGFQFKKSSEAPKLTELKYVAPAEIEKPLISEVP